jgi:hypothetical protein
MVELTQIMQQLCDADSSHPRPADAAPVDRIAHAWNGRVFRQERNWDKAVERRRRGRCGRIGWWHRPRPDGVGRGRICMPKAYASTVIDLPAEQVWATIRDFNALPTWAGHMVARSEIEDGKQPDQVGCVRSFFLHDGGHIRERLLALSDRDRCYLYNFEKTPFDVQNYEATLRVSPVTGTGQCFVEWWTTFDCAPADIDSWIDTFANGVFGGGLANLRRHLDADR